MSTTGIDPQDDMAMIKYSKHKAFLLLLIVVMLVVATQQIHEILLYLYPGATDGHMLAFETCSGILLLYLSMYYMFLRPLSREIENRVTLQKQLLEIEMNNRAVIAALPDNILRLSSDGRLLDFKYGQQDYLHSENNRKIDDLMHPDAATRLMEGLNVTIDTGAVQTFELQMSDCDKGIQHKECRMSKCGGDSVIAIIRDITEQKNNEHNLWYMSTHDTLTGLFNRSFFETEIENMAKGRGFPVSFIIIDIDGLKETNDCFGHASGDLLICTMAKILKKAFRAEDVVARLGGDEFVVMLPKSDRENVELSVSRIYRCYENEMAENRGTALEFSLGSATADNNTVLIESLKHADEMMYRNKQERKRQHA